ncbi:Gfo/Idh/MocA family protein [Pseudonocardia humida]|uniref:Gfo/Idh/MocA family oxidoreductase n=1 Tax=Pseudonocardia humida TaxID=2800819 RepID=A0ABT1A6K0_9PSEU|nr:Gfo/Idh/MocA family oxidoreductase [Pseudonocardia humida]MCO1658652.1 Gfo/Idh/MocA family oxidoreductase [Pseudonocardia humida]
MDSRRPVRFAVVGAGSRGYGHSARIEQAGGTVVAVAEPDPRRRAILAERFGVDARFPGWRELADAAPADVDAVVVATQDADHADPVERFAALGLDILCEKPMAPTEADAVRMAEAVERAGVLFAVCHSLRYTDYTRALVDLVASGRIGRVVSVQHLEPVGWWHFAHSYVRGNWRREDESSSLLMAKCCHDLDWLGHVIGSHPTSVASFGRLSHFRPENRPPGAGTRCTDCAVEPDCSYSALRLYPSRLGESGWDRWPLAVLTPTPTAETVRAALEEGPYGRCVYDCDNDVVDHQVVALDYANGVTATHTVTAFTDMGNRRTRIFGTDGCIDGDGASLTVHDFRRGPRAPVQVLTPGETDFDPVSAHSDGDRNLVAAFVTACATRDPAPILSGPHESVGSHRIVWAAERARRTGTVVHLDAQ